MNRYRAPLLAAAVVLLAAALPAQELAPVALPAPQTSGGKPLMQALQLRATARAFAPEPLPPQTLANLLWAAWGVNRPEKKMRTAPSAMNWQEIDLYVILAAGAYRYDAFTNRLQPVAAGDLRALAGRQEFVKTAPLTLVMVADTARMGNAPAEAREALAAADAAFISQNAYLFCASEGLATGVRALLDKPALARALGLAGSQQVVFAQSVGFPAK